VLLANVLRLAAAAEVRAMYLCRAEDVLRACHRQFPVPRVVPAAWRTTYDATAEFFGMKLVRLKEDVNIQIFQRQPRVATNCVYGLSITPAVEGKLRILFGEDKP